MEIIAKKDISHFNRELNMPIRNMRQYNDELKRRGLVSKEQGDDIARQAQQKLHKDFTPTNKTMGFLREVNNKRHRDGSVKLSGREIVYMEKLGVKFDKIEYKGLKGGWK